MKFSKCPIRKTILLLRHFSSSLSSLCSYFDLINWLRDLLLSVNHCVAVKLSKTVPPSAAVGCHFSVRLIAALLHPSSPPVFIRFSVCGSCCTSHPSRSSATTPPVSRLHWRDIPVRNIFTPRLVSSWPALLCLLLACPNILTPTLIDLTPHALT